MPLNILNLKGIIVMELIKVSVENINGVLVTTSNRVAEELGVNHKDLLEKIEGYIEKFTKAESSALGENLDFTEFYIPSSYKVEGNFKSYKNYLITQKGIAQLIGGYNASVPIAFVLNVAYINEFERMKNHIKSQKLPQTYLEALKELVKVEEEKERLLKENIENKPKVEYHDVILDSEGTLTTTQIAKEYGKSAVWLNKYLKNRGVQYKKGNQWYIYSKYADKGYIREITTYNEDVDKSFTSMRWTNLGRKFIYELLKDEDILPIRIEEE